MVRGGRWVIGWRDEEMPNANSNAVRKACGGSRRGRGRGSKRKIAGESKLAYILIDCLHFGVAKAKRRITLRAVQVDEVEDPSKLPPVAVGGQGVGQPAILHGHGLKRAEGGVDAPQR